MSTANFLIELGTEELPPTALKNLAQSFLSGVENQLSAAGLTYSDSRYFASPRRLAIYFKELNTAQTDREEELLGPNVQAAFDADGKPTGAAIGFSKKCGVEISSLSRKQTDKGERLCYVNKITGKNTAELLPEFLSNSLQNLPIPKRMRWGSSRVEFVRPVHWLLALQDETIIPCEILGLQSSNKTFGHRFHAPQEIEIKHADHYVQILETQGFVVADLNKRQSIIKKQLNNVANTLGGSVFIDENLLEEVTALVEYPVALAGRFDASFLDVPAEALMSSMMEHQKYFPVFDANNNLMPNFITVANIKSTDEKQVVDGNERVIRPRLSDAKFFFETDKKTSLESRLEKLKTIVFQQELGTVFEKSNRISDLSALIAELLNCDAKQAARAGLLAKADLVSDMVLEFDKMQGIAGAYYAKHDGELDVVSDAIKNHYLPKFSGDTVPVDPISCAVALADRIDTLVGIFGIKQAPTGSKDPFALRRQCLAVIRIIQENKFYRLNLSELIRHAISLHGKNLSNSNTQQDVEDFFIDRYKAIYQEQGVATEIISAVQATKSNNPYDFDLRIHAVTLFSKMEEAESLASANKRVSNILKKSDQEISPNINSALLTEEAEITLSQQIATLEQQVALLCTEQKYSDALALLAGLKSSVDLFFENVMVMVDDVAVKNNRLALLNKLHKLFANIADISQLNSK